jgi:pimeloyl-ACP methyl ester carboxylesterase
MTAAGGWTTPAAAIMPPMPAIELQVPGATLHADRRDSRYDDGPVIVALHAGVADSRAWSAVFDLLEGVPTLLAYDRRGFGSSAQGEQPYDSLDDLGHVLAQVAPTGAWLLGNSMGGRLALDLAVAQPDRVAGLVLLSPGVSGAPDKRFDDATAQLFDAGARAYDAGDSHQVSRIDARIWLDGPDAAEGRIGGATRELALDMDAVALRCEAERERLERDPGVPAWDRLPELATPVTVACGLLDIPAIVAEGRAIAERIPEARFVELEDVAHLPALEAPERVAELVRRALP